MKITGVTIIKDAIKNDYPIVEAITSILPLVDEMVVSIGQSDDGTEDLIKSINSKYNAKKITVATTAHRKLPFSPSICIKAQTI